MDWLKLDSTKQLEAIIDLSYNQEISGILIFKHSTRCPTSAMAVNRIEKGWKVSPNQVPVYFLDLLAHREISDTIASNFNVIHESPQVLIIKDGICIYNASHNSIKAQTIVDSIGLNTTNA